MAKQMSGARSLTIGTRKITLKFDAGTLMELEDWFDCPVFEVITERFTKGAPRFRDMIALYCAARGLDFNEPKSHEKALTEMREAGIETVMPVLVDCLASCLGLVDAEGNPRAVQEAA